MLWVNEWQMCLLNHKFTHARAQFSHQISFRKYKLKNKIINYYINSQALLSTGLWVIAQVAPQEASPEFNR